MGEGSLNEGKSRGLLQMELAVTELVEQRMTGWRMVRRCVGIRVLEGI